MTTAKTPTASMRPAASIVLIRDGAQGLEVFMLERHQGGAVVFAGAMVFPGGKVDTEDAAAEWDRLAGPAPAGPERRFWITAVRETFEEAGVLLARKAGGSAIIDGETAHMIVEAARASGYRNDSGAFASVIAGNGLTVALDGMVHFGHWITPDWQPKRFDTHFFLAAAPADQVDNVDMTESAEGLWLAPQQVLDDAAAGTRKLVAVTRFTLELLASWPTVAHAMAEAKTRRIVTVCPWREQTANGVVLRIPKDAGYLTSELAVVPD